VVKTPEPNMVEGMQWFQTTYTRRFNVKNRKWGHLFGGRYSRAQARQPERSGDSRRQTARKGCPKGDRRASTRSWSSIKRVGISGTQAFREKLLDRLGRPDLEAGRKT